MYKRVYLGQQKNIFSQFLSLYVQLQEHVCFLSWQLNCDSYFCIFFFFYTFFQLTCMFYTYNVQYATM